ncbi:SRPBCC family protein [Lolliginicoccus levis]|uniref:SRPBCC family protein n=1 Tax=Lolliginicoccus levis TaxID=2919542 RepID=UPI00241DE9D9|nr:SRPBCC family protein [Lolliginicoccus levis]
MPWFPMERVADLSYFDTAAHTLRYDLDLTVEADRIWSGLVADRPLAWCQMLSGGYTSSRPFGVGTTRTVTVGKVLTLREQFFSWDSDTRRHAFFVEASSLPVFRSFAESYAVTPTPDGCRFTWQFAFEPRNGMRLPLAVAQPLTRRILFDGFIRDTTRHFSR